MKKQVILIPGLTYDKNLFRYQTEHLKDRVDFTVIENQSAGADDMANVILNAVDGPFSLVSHSSVGCLPAFEAAAKAPERVTELITFGACAEPSDDLIAFLKDAIKNINAGGLDAFKQTVLNTALGDGHPNQAELIQLGEATQTISQEQIIEQCQHVIDHLDARSLLPKITAKTLVVHSENDAFFNLACATYLQKHIKGSQLIIVPDAGHMLPIEHPVACTVMMEMWLKV